LVGERISDGGGSGCEDSKHFGETFMPANLDETLETMRKEIDALQIANSEKLKPWYMNMSLMVAVIALLFSFGTTYVSYRKSAAQDIQASRQELRGLLTRLAAIPRDNVDNVKRYAGDPAAAATIGGYLNQENTLLSRQAAEIAKKLPPDDISAIEYFAVATALENAYDLTGTGEFLNYAVQTAKDFNTEIAALRATANLQFIQGHREAGRVSYQKSLDIFSKYPGYDDYTKTSTNIWTELYWANSEGAAGSIPLAMQHVNNAESLVAGLISSPGADSLKAQISQSKEMFMRSAADNSAIPAKPNPVPLPVTR
jgi:hypothetical protein